MVREGDRGPSPIGAVLGDRALRALVVASTLATLAEATLWVAVLVFAFDIGGPAVAGLVAALQLLPAGAVAIAGGSLGGRIGSGAMAWSLAGMAAVVAATALVVESAELWPVVVAGVVVSAGFAVVRPRFTSILPTVSADPGTLVAANGLMGAGEALSWVLGPLAASALLAVGIGPGLAFVAAVLVAAALTIAGLGVAPVRSLLRRGSGAFRFAHLRAVGVLLGLGGLQQFVLGALEVVVVAVAFDRLLTGETGAGLLLAAQGLGGVIGSSLVARLGSRGRVVPALVAASMLFGASIASLGLVPGVGLAIVMLLVAGAGEMAMDVLGRTLVQRVAAPHLMARAFGTFEGLRLWSLAAGSFVAGALVTAIGAGGAAAALGLAIPVAVLAAIRSIRAAAGAGVDREWLAAVGRTRLCGPLSLAATEGLAAAASEVVMPAGARPIVEGEDGEQVFLILDGCVAVERGGIEVVRLGPGDHVGEIALVRGGARTATVTVVEEARFAVVDGGAFLEAVLGNPVAATAIDDDVRHRLDDLRRLADDGEP